MRTYKEKETVTAPPEKKIKKRDKDATKLALLQAGLEVFASRGYDAATTKEVALQAGVSEGLIQRYYQSKAGLLLAIIKHFQKEEEDCHQLPPASSSSNLEAELRAFLEHHIDHAQENKDFMRVAVSRSIVDPDIAKEIAIHLFEGKVPALVERLESHLKKGGMAKQKDIQGIALTLLTVGFSLGFHGHILFGLPAERSRELCAIFAKILASGMGGKK